MKLSLQQRLILGFVPILLLLGTMGVFGRFLLDRLGNAANAILRENYDSVDAMVGLNEALERIDSSFQFGLHGREGTATDFENRWRDYDRFLDRERRNITLPGEKELVEQLDELTSLYRAEGAKFFRLPGGVERKTAYDGDGFHPGLHAMFLKIKEVSENIRTMNQRNMESASRDARNTAESSRIWFTAGIVIVALLVTLLAWWTTRAVVRPIRDLTSAAEAIGKGNLHQTVSVLSHDELGNLAETFNLMASQLRDLRESNLARLVRTQRASQATIDSFPDPIMVIDPDGRVEMANPLARRLFGVSPGENTEAANLCWIPPEPLQKPLQEAMRSRQASMSLSFDRAVTFHLGNEERIFLPHFLPIRDPQGTTLGTAVVLNDVTRFRLMDQFKSDLVATVSHELKTPLTSVRLALHVLLEETIGALTPKQLELLVDARDNSERLLSLIDHLLALARIENSTDTLTLVSSAPLAILRQAADAARSRAQDKHVELVVQEEGVLPWVAVDPERFAVALGNLVENAVTYTPQGGTIALTATALNAQEVLFTVADTGIGIPPEDLPHVFEKFFRVPGHREESGTGLGLAIVKEIVTAHRGLITCESRPERGTTFRITLPVADSTKSSLEQPS